MPLPPFQLTVDQHRSQLERFLAATVGPDDAQDCLQETLIAALRAYPRLRAGSNVRAWLFTIARNKELDDNRARERAPRRAPGAGAPPGAGAGRARGRGGSRSDARSRAGHGLERARGRPRAVGSRARPARKAARRRGAALRQRLLAPRGGRRARLQRGSSAPQPARGPVEASEGDRMSIEERLRKGSPGTGAFDAAGFAERAESEGLVDVAYAHADSPLGPLLLASTPRGLACVSYSEFREEDETLERLAARLSPRGGEAPARLDAPRRPLA